MAELIFETKLGENSVVVSKIDDESQEETEGNDLVEDVEDMSRFVTKVLKRLELRKSYLIWIAVACLGKSAVSDLVKEVGIIQTCGGLKIADGLYSKVGTRVFWKIIKARKPNVYKQIMERGLEFEMDHYRKIMKMGKKKHIKQVLTTFLTTSQNIPAVTDHHQQLANADDASTILPFIGFELPTSSSGPQHGLFIVDRIDRIRMPVSNDRSTSL